MRACTRFIRHRRIAAAALLAALLAAPLWLPAVGTALVVAHPLAPADAVVPLAGGTTRVDYAADLLGAGYAPRLVITDMARVGPTDALRSTSNAAIASARGIPAAQLYATTRIVYSTFQELVALSELARRAGWRSLIVVTSPQHTRRTSLLAGRVFAGSGITVIVRPVIGYGEDPAGWWRSTDGRTFTAREYAKLVALFFGYYG